MKRRSDPFPFPLRRGESQGVNSQRPPRSGRKPNVAFSPRDRVVRRGRGHPLGIPGGTADISAAIPPELFAILSPSRHPDPGPDQHPSPTPASCPMNVPPIIALASLLAVAPPDNGPAGARGCWSSPKPPGSATMRSRPASRPSGSRQPRAASSWTPPKTLRSSRRRTGRYRAIVFLNTSGEVFDDHQKAAFQGFIEGGGGLAAVHQGITTLEKWPWYVALVGGVKFAGHPQVQKATCRREVRDHPATKSLPDSWEWTDEWYNFNPNPRPRTHVLLTVDEASYRGGTMGKDHPISWYHEPGKGRLVHGPGAHEGGLRPAGLAQAPARAASGMPRASSRPSRRPITRRRPPPSRGLRPVRAASTQATPPAVATCSSMPRAPAAPGAIGHGRGRRHRPGPLRGRRQVQARPADRVGARTLAPHRRGVPPEVLATADGRVLSGLVHAESDRGPDPGRRRGPAAHPGQGRDRGARSGAMSMMPDWLAAGLSPSKFADLIAYLETPPHRREATPGSGVTGPIPCRPASPASGSRPGSPAQRRWPSPPTAAIFICEQTGHSAWSRTGRSCPSRS